MYLVEGKFPDYTNHDREGSFALNPDKAMHPSVWLPPINWSGFVNNTKVDFIQVSSDATDKDDFDFGNFPQKFNSAISYIIEAIDKEMKCMD